MNIIIVGAGPAGLMAGYQFLKKGHSVCFFDHKKQAGRKFLVAGHGGFNLTHSQSLSDFVLNYNHHLVRDSVFKFTNEDTVSWLEEIGIPTFIGSSGKIFPKKEIKPIDVLNALLRKITSMGGVFFYEHSFTTFDDESVIFKHKEKEIKFHFDYLIFALGGASWKKTGSDGSWKDLFREKGILFNEFQSSNAGMNVHYWNPQFEGLVIKNCEVSMGNETKKGEVLFTDYGLEGAPIYALNKHIRAGDLEVFIDLKPSLSLEKVKNFLTNEKLIRAKQLEQLKITKPVVAFIKTSLSKEAYLDADFLANYIKNMPFKIVDLRPIDEAISTVGGIAMNEIIENFELINHPKRYVIGEMLDWDAPTGGYLLQACFSMGFVVSEKFDDAN